jgi:hypothetical protein
MRSSAASWTGYVHRRLWPALVRLAGELKRDRLAEIRELHTSLGRHEVKLRAFPEWVSAPIHRAAARLTDAEARIALGTGRNARTSSGQNRDGVVRLQR